MNADDFRKLYQYHFTINRKIWTECVLRLSDEQFTQEVDYSIGSVRNQVVHMPNVDDRWFSGLHGEEVPPFLDPQLFFTREEVRQMWDGVEDKMMAYLQNLHDDDLQKPLPSDPTDDPMKIWQVLIHVANHGTDHRAQLLSILNKLGVQTFPQDFVFFLWGKM